MPKGTFLDDTLEQGLEFAKTTVKKSGSAVKQTFSPLNILENVIFQTSSTSQIEKDKAKKQTHTPLNFQKLQEKYKDQDKMKTEVLRQRLFQLVKSGDEKSLSAKKQKEHEKKRKEFYFEEDKKRKQVEKKKKESYGVIPHGIERRSIFSSKKMAKREQVEVRPAAGKQ